MADIFNCEDHVRFLKTKIIYNCVFIQQAWQKHSKKCHILLYTGLKFVSSCAVTTEYYCDISVSVLHSISCSAIGKEDMSVIKNTTWEYHITHVHTKQMEKYLILLTWTLQNNNYITKMETLTSCHLVHFQCNFIIYHFNFHRKIK